MDLFLLNYLEGDDNETDEDVDHEEGDDDEIDEVIEEYHGPEWMNVAIRWKKNKKIDGWFNKLSEYSNKQMNCSSESMNAEWINK